MQPNSCPACGKDPKDTLGADTSRKTVSIRAGEPLPNRCIECGEETSGTSRVLMDDTGRHPDRFWLVTILLAVVAMFAGVWMIVTRKRRPTLDMDLPHCERCRLASGKPVVRHVDWATHEVTLTVDSKFRSALRRLRKNRRR